MTPEWCSRIVTLALVVALHPCVAGAGGGAVGIVPSTLSEVTVAVEPDQTVVHIKTVAAAKYRSAFIDRPYRLLVDFEDTAYRWRNIPLTVATGPVKQIRGSQFRKGIARVVVEFTRKVRYAIREDRDGLAIVIALEAADNREVKARVGLPDPRALEQTAIQRGGLIAGDAGTPPPVSPGLQTRSGPDDQTVSSQRGPIRGNQGVIGGQGSERRGVGAGAGTEESAGGSQRGSPERLHAVTYADGAPATARTSVSKGQRLRLVTTKSLEHVAVGDVALATVELVSTVEVLVLGKEAGLTSLIFWYRDRTSEIMELVVQQEPSIPAAGLTISPDGRLSARLSDAGLVRVLEGIGEQTGIRFRIGAPLTDAVTAEFARLPLDQGIRRLLRNENYALVYRRDTNDVLLQEVWVFPPAVAPDPVFVIGDLNAVVGNAVTFWGAQWAKVNSLSGGPAPNAFKGFADNTSPTPPTCGGTWTTDPGNSSGPPATVPPFMAVIASSSINKADPAIFGDTPKVVMVKTNPGYEPAPGHIGTGTVVAVLCGG